LTSKSTLLFRLFLSIIDRYVWEPLFWLLTVLFLSGLEEISEIRKGVFYISQKRRILNAASMIFVALFFLWYYWLRPGGMDKLISM